MIRPAATPHPQANQLRRAHIEFLHKQRFETSRFGGTEADSTAPIAESVPWPYEPEGWPTTKRYARTMHGVDSAWPTSAEYADPFERFEQVELKQHEQAVALSWKWGTRALYLVALGVAVWFAHLKGWL